MAKAYSEEIVYTTTQDGFVLEGVVIRPTAASSLPVAVIWVHGLMGKFYSPTEIRVSRDLAAEGYAVVSGNNRGHHFGATIRRENGESVLAGAAGSISTNHRTTWTPGSRSWGRSASSGWW